MGLSVDILTWLKKVAYIKSEIDNKLSGKSDTGHTHDERYYTETEIDNKVSALESSIGTKANADHNHNTVYAPISHTHGKADITDFAHTHTGADVLVSSNTTLSSKISSIESDIQALQQADWKISIVASLPATGAAGTLYFVSNGESGSNQYIEYIWDSTNERFEALGERTIDLSDYVKIADCGLSLSDTGILTLTVE